MLCPEWIVGVAWLGSTCSLSLILCLGWTAGWPGVLHELHRGYISFSASVLRTRLSSEEGLPGTADAEQECQS